VKGTPLFAKEFQEQGPRDHAGRSLRELDLTRRMFRYQCSFSSIQQRSTRYREDLAGDGHTVRYTAERRAYPKFSELPQARPFDVQISVVLFPFGLGIGRLLRVGQAGLQGAR
jgi:hypothetical protein